MSAHVDLYDHSYSQHSQRVYAEIRRETYGDDLGQTGWMTATELQKSAELLKITSESHVLEIGCGAGGCALHLASKIGANITGIDLNGNGIENARALAKSAGIGDRLHFENIDASQPLPFADQSFDAIFSNDAMCHIPHRLAVLQEWRRILRPNGRILFTDAMVVTGIVTNAEIATRSSIGYYLFIPENENERLIEAAGFEMISTDNLTRSEAEISKRWLEARERRRKSLIEIEGEQTFEGLQDFLACVHNLSSEQRLSRFLYLGFRPAR